MNEIDEFLLKVLREIDWNAVKTPEQVYAYIVEHDGGQSPYSMQEIEAWLNNHIVDCLE
jgi:hypothetical protein